MFDNPPYYVAMRDCIIKAHKVEQVQPVDISDQRVFYFAGEKEKSVVVNCGCIFASIHDAIEHALQAAKYDLKASASARIAAYERYTKADKKYDAKLAAYGPRCDAIIESARLINVESKPVIHDQQDALK